MALEYIEKVEKGGKKMNRKLDLLAGNMGQA